MVLLFRCLEKLEYLHQLIVNHQKASEIMTVQKEKGKGFNLQTT